MSEQKQKKEYNYTRLGILCKAKKFDDEPADSPSRYYIKLEQTKDFKTGALHGEAIFPITLANGVVLNEGDSLHVKNLSAERAEKVKNEELTQEQADKSAFKMYSISLKEEVGASKKSGPAKVKKSDIDF